MKRRFVSLERAREIARHAILNGYGELVPVTAGTGPWSVGGQEIRDGLPVWQKAVRLFLNMDCSDPHPFELVARWSARARSVARPVHPDGLMVIFGLARCRKCQPCRDRRSMFWAGRALDEFRSSARTYLGTFTTSVEVDQEFDWRLEVGGWLNSEGRKMPPMDIYGLPEARRFEARASIFGAEVTKWLKSIRKGQDRPLAGGHWSPELRYLLIAEAHDGESTGDWKRGRPHFHILLHEQEAGAVFQGDLHQCVRRGRSYELVKRRVFERGQWVDALWASNDAWAKTMWKHGHSSFRLCVDARTAVYPCKYLTKGMRLRVRASQGYGGGRGNPSLMGAPATEWGTHDPPQAESRPHPTTEEGGQGETPRRFPPRAKRADPVEVD